MKKKNKPKRWWLTPCGLDCGQCTIHRRTKEELDYWRKKKVDPEKIRCDGCRSDRTGRHWSPDCKILHCCVYQRNLEFCAQCPDFPCPMIAEWGKQYDHHGWAVKNLEEMKEKGVEQWLKERKKTKLKRSKNK